MPIARAVLLAALPLISLVLPAVGSDHPEVVAQSRWQWTGIGVTDDHTVFVNFPRWSDRMAFSVGRLDERGVPEPFPSPAWNDWQPGQGVDERKFVAVQSVVIDDRGELWVLDTGNPFFGGVIEGATRLFRFDPDSGGLLRTYTFEDAGVVLPGSYLNDVRFDHAHGFAYLTDSGAGGLVALNLRTGQSRRVLGDHPSTMAEPIDLYFDGQKWSRDGQRPQVHADGIAYDPQRDVIYYQALTGKTMYTLPGEALRDWSLDDETIASRVETVGEHYPVDGLIADDRGRVYLSNLQESAVDRYDPLRPGQALERLAQGPEIAWPDSFSLTGDGWLYFTSAQIHAGDNPNDPYRIFRIMIGSPANDGANPRTSPATR